MSQTEAAIAGHDDLITRFGDNDTPEMQIQLAMALFNKAYVLAIGENTGLYRSINDVGRTAWRYRLQTNSRRR